MKNKSTVILTSQVYQRKTDIEADVQENSISLWQRRETIAEAQRVELSIPGDIKNSRENTLSKLPNFKVRPVLSKWLG